MEFTTSIDIARPPAEVFALVTDPDKVATWQRNTVSVEAAEPGPLRLGSTTREVHAGPFGSKVRTTVEVVDFEPDRRCGLRIVEGFPLDGTFHFVPSAMGTTVRLDAHGRLRGPAKLAAPLLSRVVRRKFDEHLANLKEVLERAQ